MSICQTISGERYRLTDDPRINDLHKIEVDPLLNYTINVSLFFNHDAGNLDLEWLNSTGTVLGSSTSETDNESIKDSIFSNGTDDTYYLRVHSLSDNILLNNYRLTYILESNDCPDAPSSLDDFGIDWDWDWDDDFGIDWDWDWDDDFGIDWDWDWDWDIDFESNNTRQTAEDIRFLEGERLTGGLITSNDDDWYEIEVDSGLNSTINASLFFNHDAGDLDFELVNSTGTVLGSSTSETDNESIQASNLSNGIYYLRVYSWEDNILGNEYSLEWDDSLL